MAEWLGVSLPLGRHSIMNGIGISMSATRPEFEDGGNCVDCLFAEECGII